MRASTLLPSLLCLLCLPALADAGEAPARPATQAALVDAAMAAVEENDPEAYLALFPKTQEFVTHCPELMADPKMSRAIREIHQNAGPHVRKKIQQCHELIDFSRAKRVRVEGGQRHEEPEEGCRDLFEVGDILVFLEVGGKTYTVKLDDPYVMGTDAYGLMDDPRCSEWEER